MNKYKLQNFIKKRKCTLLGIGPMSINCVDATIELSSEFNIPLFLIASRRQIDSYELGGGYVNNWTTKQFADYVIDKDKKGNILLSRDHGGPWQNSKEIDDNLSLNRAMESAKKSFLDDIRSGFQVIHIDPSIDIHKKTSVDEILERIYELYSFCYSQAQRLGKEILFEIGTEEQSGGTNSQEELKYVLNSMRIFCEKHNFPFPTFVVIQTGTKVKEMKNVGSLDSPIRVLDQLPSEIQIPKMIEICNEYSIMMKEHNADYLSDESLHWHPRLGIHASNVAPEFGVIETKNLLKILEENNLKNLSERFLELSFNSGKWKKWLLDISQTSDREKSIIAGHYIFSNGECKELKKEASQELSKKGINLENFLKDSIKKSIIRYLTHFRLIKTK